ncbi:MAG: class I tRNA ligase family protein, partial [bacterium]|nr:class I tRNA ligase family protein [bacterium]
MLPTTYNPKEHEDAIYDAWKASGIFAPEALKPRTDNPNPEAFTIVMPPPNVTGRLHMGHAMMLAIQDVMIRFERMRGKKALWIPGLDHAAIATQNVVEKDLWKKEKKTRHDVGREEFLKRVDTFVEESKSIIRQQIQKMGTSCDWSRERYTMDAGLSRAVRHVFVDLYRRGYVYRGLRLVNWCPRCSTAISDDE